MMKNILITVCAIIIIIFSIFYLYNNTQNTEIKSDEEYIIDESDFISDSIIEDISSSELSNSEVHGLIVMREEEKLARDVYLSLFEIWDLRIFSNIAKSEQTHTDAVKQLLIRYDISDPVIDDSIGLFTNKTFTDLYVSLVEKGSLSLEDALFVGATIEDLDIKDLQEFIAESDNEDINLVYNNLLKGSENHMRAFVQQLESRDGSYEAQYLTGEEIQVILNKE